MYIATHAPTGETSDADLQLSFLWRCAFIAALGGLLFGYDWVVIGGAKPFYEAYFGLHTSVLVGWANSCALIGCFAGSLIAGKLSERFGRKRVLLASALLFALTSVLTGWSHHFWAFIFWRIFGGVAIGLASNVSPMYIAEISPAAWRGRLVSVNQLAIVVGILGAQIVNWCIARTAGASSVQQAPDSWNTQFAWRWMFTAVAVPALVFLATAPSLPESPRWLVARNRFTEAANVLSRIGGERYSAQELAAIRHSLERDTTTGSWTDVLHGKSRGLLLIGITLAVLQQCSGINVLFNYAEEIYAGAGYGLSAVLFNIVITGVINLVFTLVAMLLVDRVGRRKLMIAGCLGVGVAHVAASVAFRTGVRGGWILLITLTAIACYAMTLAPVTWVLISEIFPNQIRAVAISISVGALWVSSFALTYTFPLLTNSMGTANTFLLYGALCLAGAVFVYRSVPESAGRSLEQASLPATVTSASQPEI